jgi:predicted nucleic acid-binding protein
VTCEPVILELLYSTSNVETFDRLAGAMDALRKIAISESVLRAARDAMRQLASTVPLSHRLPPIDYIVAAAAQSAGVGVLHYDEHFDRLATVLGFDSVWLAPRGSSLP